MLVQFNGTWLTNDGTLNERAISSVIDARLNGKQLVQAAQFLRAVAEQPLARGNKANVFAFKVARNFSLLLPGASNPIAQAAAFVLTHFSGLPTVGDLLVTCGGPGETPILVRGANAVLEGAPEAVFTGAAVDISYSIRCGLLMNLGPAPATVGYDGGVMPVFYTDPLQVLDGGNLADTYLNCPAIDGGTLV